jgi:NADH:ubiquinone oxidoreductase subunit E
MPCSTCTCPEVDDGERLARLDSAIAENRRSPGSLIPVLQIAQGIYGHLPDPAIRRICVGLGKSYSEVAGDCHTVEELHHEMAPTWRPRSTRRAGP